MGRCDSGQVGGQVGFVELGLIAQAGDGCLAAPKLMINFLIHSTRLPSNPLQPSIPLKVDKRILMLNAGQGRGCREAKPGTTKKLQGLRLNRELHKGPTSREGTI